MSHITTIEVQVTDLAALAKVCSDMGLELREQQTQYKTYAGRKAACDAAIVDPSNARAYEIGVVKKDDHYTVNYDGWAGGGGMMEKVGTRCSKLMQAYSIEAAKRQAKKLGWKWKEVQQEDGSVELHCSPRQKAWT